MKLRVVALVAAVWLLLGSSALAAIFGTVIGTAHDPSHLPISGAQVTLRSESSDYSQTTTTSRDGEFRFNAVPLGEYLITVEAQGFNALQMKARVVSGSAPLLHFPLTVATANENVEVTGEAETVNSENATTMTTVDRKTIDAVPGATNANSLSFITSMVPGAVVVHDQLHVRGGHQVSWLLDGVPVPNTNIASNAGPQFDPKDIDTVELQRGGYSAEFGDRTYGVFNVVTRTGFERNREAEIVASFGTQYTTNDQISFGDHTQRFAYYASLSGNRSDVGLETPTPEVVHDLAAGLSGFTSLIFNIDANDQVRFTGSARGDHYQIPNTREMQAGGIRDVDNERDALANFSWIHATPAGLMLTVSPFFHWNRAAYDGKRDPNLFVAGPNASPTPSDERSSDYAGGQISLVLEKGKNNARTGATGFAENDNAVFRLAANDGSGAVLGERDKPNGSLMAGFLEEQYRLNHWLTFTGGGRLTHFSGLVTENAADPRLGAALRIPYLGWVLRASYSRFYQAPPLSTVSGPILALALQQGFGFLPLKGERDEQHDFGLSVPIKGWVFEVNNFRTAARNFFDHDVMGNSNIFFPLTIERARIRGWEAVLSTPRNWRHGSLRVNYSNQIAEGKGAVSGGLTDFSSADRGYFLLDHDQRNTLSVLPQASLPWHSWLSATVSYGSGFLNGNGPAHLPAHTTVDLAAGKNIGERLSLRVTALNIANHRYQIDNSNTFGGTHWVSPRQIEVQLKYKIHL